jgi:putative phage-type endonuclease
MNNKNICWNDLDNLVDIIDTINPKQQRFNMYIDDFMETMSILLNEYITSNIHKISDYKYDEILFDYLYNLSIELYGEHLPDEVDILIDDVLTSYFILHTPRSYPDTVIIYEPDKKKIDEQLKLYTNMEQPEQRTPEWFNFRWTCLTASSIWKALDTDSNKNNLILSKCKPIDPKKYSSVNTSSPLHNGHRFEPLSTMWYEKRFDTVVGEFGCLRHTKYPFLGASPDGINIKSDNPRYGRAVEIKNPVNRVLTGIPKKDYWIQMQLQMEVWDLDECDFLETCFKCYENEDHFKKDGNFNNTKDGKLKGIILQFYDRGEPIYEYAPIGCSETEFDKWYDTILDKNTNITWIQNIYWWLDEWSCILVPRNKMWFECALPKFKELWDIILDERNTGYEHRKPKKRKKKNISLKDNNILDNGEIKHLFANLPDSPKIVENYPIVKIRTQSFEQLKSSQ